ncbi:MAG: Mth938-like domain-containing protein [Paracoccaceae bacterium]
MEINEVSFENSLPVTGYGIGFFRIGADIFRGNRFIYKNKIFDWNGFSDSNVILSYRNEIDVLFVGTGSDIKNIPSAFKKSIEKHDIGIEIMSTPTACRTYNVLLGEGRRIGAALLAL